MILYRNQVISVWNHTFQDTGQHVKPFNGANIHFHCNLMKSLFAFFSKLTDHFLINIFISAHIEGIFRAVKLHSQANIFAFIANDSITDLLAALT
jgi:hypothetical protein